MKKSIFTTIFIILATISWSSEEITTPTGVKMVLIKAGTFEMGAGASENDAVPVREVNISAFYMDIYEVTQESYTTLMGVNPSKFNGRKLPVERISWINAARYCNVRSKKDGLTPCYDEKTWECEFNANGYRLPTESEWEYASRAGSTSRYYFSEGKSGIAKYAWYRKNSGRKTRKVGMLIANAFGLYDMYGNVSEWCNDFYAKDYYSKGENDNPKGPACGDKKVLRGGSWDDRDGKCDSVTRQRDSPATADICQGYDTYGFRCVKNAY